MLLKCAGLWEQTCQQISGWEDSDKTNGLKETQLYWVW